MVGFKVILFCSLRILISYSNEKFPMLQPIAKHIFLEYVINVSIEAYTEK